MTRPPQNARRDVVPAGPLRRGPRCTGSTLPSSAIECRSTRRSGAATPSRNDATCTLPANSTSPSSASRAISSRVPGSLPDVRACVSATGAQMRQESGKNQATMGQRAVAAALQTRISLVTGLSATGALPRSNRRRPSLQPCKRPHGMLAHKHIVVGQPCFQGGQIFCGSDVAKYHARIALEHPEFRALDC